MPNYTTPEILRVPLAEICLNARMLIKDNQSIEQFLSQAIQPPSTHNIRQAINLLRKIDALDSNERITHLGVHLTNMPVDCQLGKSILFAVLMRCLDPVVAIASALSVKDPFPLPVDRNSAKKIFNTKMDFAENSLSDHFMLLNAFDQWTNQNHNAGQFCRDNMINSAKMQMAAGIKRLILNYLKVIGITDRLVFNKNSKRWDIVKACLTAGLYPNICSVQPISGKLVLEKVSISFPHKSSVLYAPKTESQIDERIQQVPVEWLIYGEKSHSSSITSIRNITPIPSIDIVLFAGAITLNEANIIEQNVSESVYIVDDCISFSMQSEQARMIFEIRRKFASKLMKFLQKPSSFPMDNQEDSLLKLIEKIIQQEDSIERWLGDKYKTEIPEAFTNMNWRARIDNVLRSMPQTSTPKKAHAADSPRHH